MNPSDVFLAGKCRQRRHPKLDAMLPEALDEMLARASKHRPNRLPRHAAGSAEERRRGANKHLDWQLR